MGSPERYIVSALTMLVMAAYMSELLHSFPRETCTDKVGEKIRQEYHIEESKEKQRGIQRHVIEKRNNQNDDIDHHQDTSKDEIISILTRAPSLGQSRLSGSESEHHIQNEADDIDGHKDDETASYQGIFQTLYEILQEDVKEIIQESAAFPLRDFVS